MTEVAPSTKQQIVEAALETLKTEGFAGATSRAIARVGGFNQALVFYHFGSLDNLLLAALDAMSEARMRRYAAAVEEALPVRELAYAAVTFYLGVNLLTHLDADRSRTDAVFDAAVVLAPLVSGLLGGERRS